MEKFKAAFYIDGFSLYFGLKDSNFRKYYWLDLDKLCNKIAFKNNIITSIKYFTARISSPPDKVKRQSTYLEAIETLKNVQIIEGLYYSHEVICKRCGKPYCCNCGIPFLKIEEKRTDVNIGVNMLGDAFNNIFDIAYLISGDSDLVPEVEKVKEYFPQKRIVVYFPPNRVSKDLRSTCHFHRKFYENVFRKSQLPEQLKNKFGYTIKRPTEWH